MIRQDYYSGMFIAVGVALTILLFVWGAKFESLLAPIMLLFGSGIIRIYTVRRPVPEDTVVTQSELQNVGVYALLALAGLAVGNLFIQGYFVPQVPNQILALSLPFVSTIFTVLMAISETQFFQGELLPLIGQKTGWGVAIPIVAIIGVGFHMNIYGTQPNALMYVFIGFLLLSWVAVKTRRVLTAMIGHVGNNLANFVPPLLLLGGAGLVFVWQARKERRSKWI